MRPNGMIMRYTSTGSTGSSEECSVFEEDPFVVSMHLLADPGSGQSIQKAYQGMVNMLDNDLQVVCLSDKSEFYDLPESSTKGTSEMTVPCLSAVLFFNGGRRDFNKNSQQIRKSLSKPDLLLNHMWNGSLDLEDDFQNSLDLTSNDVMQKTSRTSSMEKYRSAPPKSGRNSPFIQYKDIVEESKENERNLAEMKERDEGFRKKIFEFEVTERTLEARKQLETWPWEFHHKAHTSKGISQCHGNAQDFYAYQPDREVTRLYGDVIDTTKISRKKNNMTPVNVGKGTIVNLLRNGSDERGEKGRGSSKKPISTSDFPLMAVREVHYGKQQLRYTLFVSDAKWTSQVEFYRLLLRNHNVTLRKDFCFFTIYYGEDTDVQFALKKLSPNQRPIPLSSTVLQFKVHKVGHLVPLLPRACKPISDTKWQTKDHDGNILVLEICPTKNSSESSSSRYFRGSLPEGSITSQSEARQSVDGDEEFSLERLDSFIEPELPARMPLLQSSLYSNLTGRSRFSSRNTSSASPGSSSSTSPERRPRRMGEYTHRRMFSGSSLESGASTLPHPRHTSNSSWTSSRISDSSEDPENTNFYRRAKLKRDLKQKSETVTPPKPKPRSKSSSRATKQKSRTVHRTKSRDEEVEVYV